MSDALLGCGGTRGTDNPCTQRGKPLRRTQEGHLTGVRPGPGVVRRRSQQKGWLR